MDEYVNSHVLIIKCSEHLIYGTLIKFNGRITRLQNV